MKQPHIPLLKAFDELKFNLGKKTLVDFLKGDENPTIDRNNLDELNSYGCLYMIDRTTIFGLIDDLIKNNFLEINTVGTGFQVIKRTSLGVKEIYSKNYTPNLENLNHNQNSKVSKFNFKSQKRSVSSGLNILFKSFISTPVSVLGNPLGRESRTSAILTYGLFVMNYTSFQKFSDNQRPFWMAIDRSY